MEPKTPGTTWNYLKNACLFQKWLISQSGLKIWKWEPTRVHITCKHKGAENTGNHMEPSKNVILFQKWFISPSRLEIWKRELARFHITCWQNEPKTPWTTWNHLKMHFCSKNNLFYQMGSKSENGNQLGSI